MRAEARDLLAVHVRDREHVAVCGRPDRLRHVAEVEAAALEGAVPEHRERAEDAREGERRRARRGALASRGERARGAPRQRAPSTSSLARLR